MKVLKAKKQWKSGLEEGREGKYDLLTGKIEVIHDPVVDLLPHIERKC